MAKILLSHGLVNRPLTSKNHGPLAAAYVLAADGGRATQWARKQLRNLRDNQSTAHRLKLESMFSFLPKKLIECVHKELHDAEGNVKNQIIPRPSKHDFHGVLVMADLVKSTNLSEEMEVSEKVRGTRDGGQQK